MGSPSNYTKSNTQIIDSNSALFSGHLKVQWITFFVQFRRAHFFFYNFPLPYRIPYMYIYYIYFPIFCVPWPDADFPASRASATDLHISIKHHFSMFACKQSPTQHKTHIRLRYGGDDKHKHFTGRQGNASSDGRRGAGEQGGCGLARKTFSFMCYKYLITWAPRCYTTNPCGAALCVSNI